MRGETCVCDSCGKDLTKAFSYLEISALLKTFKPGLIFWDPSVNTPGYARTRQVCGLKCYKAILSGET